MPRKSNGALTFLVAFVLALGSFGMELRSAQGAMNCFEDWAEASDVVKREGLVTVEKLGRQFRQRQSGDIVKTELCQIGDRYTYRLVVRLPQGGFQTRVYDARLGLEIDFAGK